MTSQTCFINAPAPSPPAGATVDVAQESAQAPQGGSKWGGGGGGSKWGGGGSKCWQVPSHPVQIVANPSLMCGDTRKAPKVQIKADDGHMLEVDGPREGMDRFEMTAEEPIHTEDHSDNGSVSAYSTTLP